MSDPVIRFLTTEEIIPGLFAGYIRRQHVSERWRRENGVWTLCGTEEDVDWTSAEWSGLCAKLRDIAREGMVYAALLQGQVKGFAAIDGRLFGETARYADLSSLNVSADMRGQGLGKRLFLLAADTARQWGAEKMYISANTSRQTIAFYRAMGCVEAREQSALHIREAERCMQLEYHLK